MSENFYRFAFSAFESIVADSDIIALTVILVYNSVTNMLNHTENH